MDIKVTIRTTTMIMVITIITNQVHNDILVLHLKWSSYYVNYNGCWVRGDDYNNNNGGSNNTLMIGYEILRNAPHYRYENDIHYYLKDNVDYYSYSNGK